MTARRSEASPPNAQFTRESSQPSEFSHRNRHSYVQKSLTINLSTQDQRDAVQQSSHHSQIPENDSPLTANDSPSIDLLNQDHSISSLLDRPHLSQPSSAASDHALAHHPSTIALAESFEADSWTVVDPTSRDSPSTSSLLHQAPSTESLDDFTSLEQASSELSERTSHHTAPGQTNLRLHSKPATPSSSFSQSIVQQVNPAQSIDSRSIAEEVDLQTVQLTSHTDLQAQTALQFASEYSSPHSLLPASATHQDQPAKSINLRPQSRESSQVTSVQDSSVFSSTCPLDLGSQVEQFSGLSQHHPIQTVQTSSHLSPASKQSLPSAKVSHHLPGGDFEQSSPENFSSSSRFPLSRPRSTSEQSFGTITEQSTETAHGSSGLSPTSVAHGTSTIAPRQISYRGFTEAPGLRRNYLRA